MGSIKGIALIHVVRYLRAHRAAAARALPERLHTYLKSRILVSNWYPEDEFMELMRALVHILPESGIDPWEWIGRRGVSDAFDDLYSAMVVCGSPAATLKRYPGVWRLYHDSGRMKVRLEGPSRAHLEVDHALARIEEFCRLQSGHFAQLLLLSGANEADVESFNVGTRQVPASWVVSWTL